MQVVAVDVRDQDKINPGPRRGIQWRHDPDQRTHSPSQHRIGQHNPAAERDTDSRVTKEVHGSEYPIKPRH
jgi:hypothetical protein